MTCSRAALELLLDLGLRSFSHVTLATELKRLILPADPNHTLGWLGASDRSGGRRDPETLP